MAIAAPAVARSVGGGAPRAARPRRPLDDRVPLRLAGVVGVLAIWQVIAGTGLVSRDYVPSPQVTAQRLAGLAVDPTLWVGLGHTLSAWALGLAVSVLVAVPLGVLLATSEPAYRFVRVPVEALRPIPPIVVLPLALLVLGGATPFKVALIVQGAMWVLLVQTIYAVRGIDPVVLDTARSFRVDPVRRLVLVRLPAASPGIATGLRLAAGTAFAVAIVSELVGGARGLGQLLAVATSGNDVPTIYALVVVTGVVGLAVAGVVGALERRFLGWSTRGSR